LLLFLLLDFVLFDLRVGQYPFLLELYANYVLVVLFD